MWKATEPGTPHPRRRVEAVRKLNDAGIECGVLVAPILPGMSDRPEQIEEVVAACVKAGAVSVGGIPLHLRPGVREHFLDWLPSHRPDLVKDYERRYRGRSYLPAKEKEAVADMVHGAIRRAGGLPRPKGHRATLPAAEAISAAPPKREQPDTRDQPPPDTTQLDATQLDLAI